MKSKIFKALVISATILSVAISSSLVTFAAEDVTSTPSQEVSVVSELNQKTATPYADVIVWKYRNYNGVVQKRRWNQTKGVWVDPAWIPVG